MHLHHMSSHARAHTQTHTTTMITRSHRQQVGIRELHGNTADFPCERCGNTAVVNGCTLTSEV